MPRDVNTDLLVAGGVRFGSFCYKLTGHGAGDYAIVLADADAPKTRYTLDAAGAMEWGDGVDDPDVVLERVAPQTLNIRSDVGGTAVLLVNGQPITSGAGSFFVGQIVEYSGVIDATHPPPGGFLLADGSSFARSAFPALAEVLDPGGSATTLYLPDLRSKSTVGSSVQNTTTGLVNTPLDASLTARSVQRGTSATPLVGAEQVTLGATMLPSHTHAAGTLATSGSTTGSESSHTHGAGSYATGSSTTGAGSPHGHNVIKLSAGDQANIVAASGTGAGGANLTVGGGAYNYNQYVTSSEASHTHAIGALGVGGSSGAGSAHSHSIPSVTLTGTTGGQGGTLSQPVPNLPPVAVLHKLVCWQPPEAAAGEQGPPGEGVPVGGTSGQVLAKSSSADYDTTWENPPSGLPVGGATGQMLAKSSAADYAVTWQTPPTGIPAGGATSQILTKTSSVDYAVAWRPSPVPPGGTSGQVLAKVSGADYDTAWQPPPVGLPTGGGAGQVLTKTTSADYAATWQTPTATATPVDPTPTTMLLMGG